MDRRLPLKTKYCLFVAKSPFERVHPYLVNSFSNFIVIQEPILLVRYFNKSVLFLSTLIMLTILSPLVQLNIPIKLLRLGSKNLQRPSKHLDQNYCHWSYISDLSSVQSLSHVRCFATPWIAAHPASMSITNSLILIKLMCIEAVMPSNHLILCRPLLLLPSILPSIRVFSNESVHPIRWPKYWSFSFSISPSNEHSGLISFRMDAGSP